MKISDITNRDPAELCDNCGDEAVIEIEFKRPGVAPVWLCTACRKKLIMKLFLGDLISILESRHEKYIEQKGRNELHDLIEGNFRGDEVRAIICLIEEII